MRCLFLCVPLVLTGCGYGWQDNPRSVPQASGVPVRGSASGTAGSAANSAYVSPLAADEYIVQPGDTLYSIGFRNQIDYHDLAAWNGIGSDYLIRSGNLLRLSPPPGYRAPVTAGGVQTQPLAAPIAALPAPPPTTGLESRPALPVALPVLPAPGAAAPAIPVVVAPAPPSLPGEQAPLRIPGAAGVPPVVVAPAGDVAPLRIPQATSPISPSASSPAVVAIAPAAAPVRPVAAVTGRYAWPASGEVVKTFAPASGSKGIDIAGSLGAPVTAAAAGKVVYSGSALKGYGELVIVKHDDTYLTAYGHNRRRLVKEGDTVAAGQPIGEIGPGPDQKPALHFEVRERGKPVDPMRFLPGR